MSELRGRMVNEVLRMLRVHKPPVIMLENVRNIAGPRQRDVWAAVVHGLREAGYRVPDAPAVFSLTCCRLIEAGLRRSASGCTSWERRWVASAPSARRTFSRS